MFPGDVKSMTSFLQANVRAAGRITMLLALLVITAGCQQEMANQPSYDPYESSDFFADGMSARPRVAGTVARGEWIDDPFLTTGKVGGALADGFPFPVTRAVLERGKERYDIYCAACHDRIGSGYGMIVQRGFRRPPSLHVDRLRTIRTGHLFDVITNGYGAMPPYSGMLVREDRWAVIAYIRALQLSQNATIADVPPKDRTRLLAGGAR